MDVSESPKDWWAPSAEQLVSSLKTSEKGISESEARRRLAIFGYNRLAERKRFTIIERFFAKLVNPLILLLLFAAFISALLGQRTDFFIILVITLVSIIIDVYQEHQAVEGARRLRKRVSITATVVRDGTRKEIPMSHLVPGDLVVLSVGDIVPADGRLLSTKDLLLDQSALTGESYPQHKDEKSSVAAKIEVAGRTNSVFMGTNVISGEGIALIVATGKQTELGKIAKELVEKRPQTEFEKGITKFGYLLMQTAIIIAAFVFLSHVLIHRDIFSTLLFVLALAIGFAPELLPAVVTINLSKGALKMEAKGVIVKSLPAIENFGSMDTFCTDKTGTLTENKIVLRDYEDIGGKQEERVLGFGFLSSFYQMGFRGPLERAILAHKAGPAISEYRRVGAIPFDFYRKRVTVVVSHKKEGLIFITKGAPEEMIEIATHYEAAGKKHAFTHEAKEKALRRFETISKEGLRVLAVAYKIVPQQKTFAVNDEKDLTFLGFLTFFDPPKKTVSDALKLLEHQGIVVKILTGDNELVTQKVCEDIGLPVSGTVTGKDIEPFSDIQLAEIVDKTTIFARLNPDLKVRIINTLKAKGHVVGFLGDGINDSPSLKVSDIGISVDNATDVAKETADIILLHKDLHVLSEGVASGRKTFRNVMKYIMMGTSSNFGNMISIALASVFLPFLPMLPIQVLLNDLLYDVSQLFVANDRVDGRMIAKPRRWDITFIRRFMLIFGPVSSVFDMLIFAVLLFGLKANASMFQTGWFVESLVTQTLIVFSIRTVFVPFWQSRPSRLFAAGLVGVAALAVFLPFSPVAHIFSFVALPLSFYGLMVMLIGVYLFFVELLKYWFYRRYQL